MSGLGGTEKVGVVMMALLNNVFSAYGQAAYDRTIAYAEKVGTHNVDQIADWAAKTFGMHDGKKGKKRNRSNASPKVRNANGLLITENVPNGYIQEAQTLGSSLVSLGKAAYERNYMDAFLRMMNGKSRVFVQYGHLMDFGLNKRSIHVECFRHSVGSNAADRSGWNTMYPLNGPHDYNLTLKQAMGYTPGNDGTPGYPVISSYEQQVAMPFVPVQHGENSMSAITRPMLEDESWNQNRLKFDFRDLSSSAVGSTEDHDVKFLPMVTTKKNEWRNSSYLRQHNNQLNGIAISGTLQVGQHIGPPVQYDSVLNRGKITYKLMNKGAFPINVEFIIYKYKKDRDAMQQDYEDMQETQIYDSIVEPIEQAYLDKKSQYLASNIFSGRAPSKTDVTTDPRFKCLPNIARMKEYKNPWKEETRFTCCIPSGSRKLQQIILPGHIYNPVDITRVSSIEGANPVCDSMTYAVAIAASGTLTTQDMHGIGSIEPHTTNNTRIGVENFIGDCYSEGQLQWLVEYEEEVSACIPRMPYVQKLLSMGEVNQADGTVLEGELVKQYFEPRAAPIIPATNVVRNNADGITLNWNNSLGAAVPVFAEMGSSGMSAKPKQQNPFAQGTATDEQGNNPTN